jgi:ribose transport system substrate-binding protein
VVLRLKSVIASLAVVVIGVSGCSSSSGAGHATTTAGASTGTSSNSSASAGLAAAEAATTKAMQAPTTIPLQAPLRTKPPTGKTFVWMKCDAQQCQDLADAIKQATSAIGWNYKEIPFKNADPATLVSALNQALTLKPTSVGLAGIPEALWSSVIPAYKAAGVTITTILIGPMSYDNTVIGQAGAQDTAAAANIMANWAIGDSNGHAHVLLETINEFPIALQFGAAYDSTFKTNCPGCSVTVVNNTLAQLASGAIPGTVVAALQKDPSLNYVVTVDGPFLTGVPSALAAAGLSKVKLSGASGDVSELTDVKAGTESAFTGVALDYEGWQLVDMAARHLEGVAFDPDGDGGLPVQLLTKDVPFTVQDSYNQPADWQDQLKKLWLVG